MNQQQVQLPERVTIELSAQDAVTILNALSGTGPYKTVAPIISSVQQQVFAQQIKPRGPPVPDAPMPDDTVADPQEVTAHHPV